MKQIFISVCMLIALQTQSQQGVNAIKSGTVYRAPNFMSYAYSTKSNPFVAAGYGGQCTAYAFGRALEVTGKRMDCTGNPKDWIKYTKYPTGSIPKPNSLAIWGGTLTDPTGHVAFVELVSNNGYITISEANVKNYQNSNYGGGYDGTRIFSVDEMKDRTKAGTGKVGKLLGYIYLLE